MSERDKRTVANLQMVRVPLLTSSPFYNLLPVSSVQSSENGNIFTTPVSPTSLLICVVSSFFENNLHSF